MIQVCTTVAGLKVTAADTTAAPVSATSSPCKGVTIKADEGNDAAGVLLGGVGVAAATGFPLYPGEQVTLPFFLDNLTALYYKAAAAGDILYILVGR